MQFLQNIKIGTRLALAFGILILMLTLLGLTGIYQVRETNDYASDLGQSWLPRVRKLADISNELGADRRTVLRHIIERSPDAKKEAEALIAKRHQQVLPKMLKEYEAMITSQKERETFAVFTTQLDRYHKLADDTLALSRVGESGFDATNQQDKDIAAPAFRELTKALAKSFDYAGDTGAQVAAASSANYSQTVYVSIAAILAAVALGAIGAIAVTRSIVRPLAEGVKLAEAVAEGDLRSRIAVQGSDELADLLRALQNMNQRLVDMVGSVRLSSDNIATGSTEIAMGNSDLSQRTERQASNLEETAASMEELSATVKNNAGLAQEANRLATAATSAAEQGGQVVGQVVSTMQEISASSRKISDIIGVIDGIAFQTNILALNAAVEAARAGEQGRGFAVVASEVRSLAQRSANAAKEIKGLIGASVEKVESGTQLVDEAGRNMEGIVGQVRQVRNLIGEIASASSEQSCGIEQVGIAVTQMDQATQQNAALVEESAAAAASLQAQAEQLAELVSVFKLSDSGLRASRPAHRASGTPASGLLLA
ncbi:HAMP domain-containing protein [Xylophilus rhododendri]|uniref:HAMP domain-containing protein n=1 Tax=Xylophilus rhododendri TaxID=2697032 RepID=A0A857J0E3_9BURK|nr:methyl-accepting chemotaxis protein [Xylophilus rhododendri]QHI96581.1 HAMP domain-containing protein [Xylophilus rhododendri]